MSSFLQKGQLYLVVGDAVDVLNILHLHKICFPVMNTGQAKLDTKETFAY